MEKRQWTKIVFTQFAWHTHTSTHRHKLTEKEKFNFYAVFFGWLSLLLCSVYFFLACLCYRSLVSPFLPFATIIWWKNPISEWYLCIYIPHSLWSPLPLTRWFIYQNVYINCECVSMRLRIEAILINNKKNETKRHRSKNKKPVSFQSHLGVVTLWHAYISFSLVWFDSCIYLFTVFISSPRFFSIIWQSSHLPI